MNERMTDEQWNHLNASETVWTKREQAEVAGEVNALQIDVMEKDAQIKALADALEAMMAPVQEAHGGICATDPCARCQSTAALRLAGYLK